MRFADFETTVRLLDFPGLVEALRDTYKRGVDTYDRRLLVEPLPNGEQNDWLLQPAWQYGRNFGIKLVSIFPGNEAKGVNTILGAYVLFDGGTGMPQLVIDGVGITFRKTAANSALAADYLARNDAKTLLMIGAGALAPHLIEAHSAVRKYERVLIWNRTHAKAETIAKKIDKPGYRATAMKDLKAAVGEADVISAATFATDPLIKGAWLKPGTHVDLVGGYRPDLRESDDEAVKRSRVFVDWRPSTIEICGDICQPIASGLTSDAAITDTFQLARGEKPGRQNATEITLFKSGGGGHEDLGTAQYLLSRLPKT
jgi:ornithine cyclodeaminase